MPEPTQTTDLRIPVDGRTGEVSALLLHPHHARCLLVLAHGAGAGMRHRFMDAIARHLAAEGIASLRYQFPYMEAGRRRPDPPATLVATVRSAVDAARRIGGDLPLLAGGKSLGGRMTSTAAADTPLPAVRGLVFLGFPLHAARRPGDERARHLSRVTVPMLFLQGTRDDLADLSWLRPVCAGLGDRAHLHVVDAADHSFKVLKRSGRTEDEVLEELGRTVRGWADDMVGVAFSDCR